MNKVIVEKNDGYAVVSLNRPDSMNALSRELRDDFVAALEDCQADEAIQVLIITGKGKAFSAGFDLKTFASGDMEKISKMSDLGMRFMYDIFTFPRPVIAALTGHTVAMGLFVACGCDYRIGLKGEFVAQANEVRNNMDIPTSIMQIAASRISKRHAYSVLLHADPFSFANAVDAGIIDEVVEEQSLEDASLEKAKYLATMGHPSYSMTKELLIAEPMQKINDAIKEAQLKNNSI